MEASVLLAETVFDAVTPLLAVHVAADPVPPVRHEVPLAVLFAGFTPACAEVFAFPLTLDDADVDDEALACPGAFAEFPCVLVAVEAETWPAVVAWELPFPWPLPARAEAVNVVRATVSNSAPTMPVKRLIISFSPRSRTTVLDGLPGFQTGKSRRWIRLWGDLWGN